MVIMPGGIYERKRSDPVQRFWSKVDKSGEHWLFTGATNNSGYGTFKLNTYETVLAHRYAWTLKHGFIPTGMEVLHKCDIRNCVTDECPFLGFQIDNIYDMETKGRALHPVGSANGLAKLTEDKVLEIRKLYTTGTYTRQYLASMFDVGVSTIGYVINRNTWKHV